jgi:predicted phosphoribosyltransferase
MFPNRKIAGQWLVNKLKAYQNSGTIVLAVPRGGVPVAYEIAKELNLPLEVILVKKIGHPLNKEYAIGAASLTDSFVVPHDDVTEWYVQNETERVRTRLREMKEKFLAGREPEEIKDKTVIVIDDGIATGNTLLATVKLLKQHHPAKIVIAVPVISKSAAEKLGPAVDELIALIVPDVFYGVGNFYNDFEQVTDEEVIHCLQSLRELRKAG